MSAALLRVAGAAVGERRLLAITVALGTTTVLAGGALLATSGQLISRAALQPPVLALALAIVAVRALGIVRALARYGERLAGHDLALRMLAALRVRWYRRLAPLVPGALRGMRSGDLLSRFVGDVDELQHVYVRGLAPPLVAVASTVVLVGAAALVLPAAGAVLAAGLLAGGVFVPAVAAWAARSAGRRQAPARAALAAELVELLEGGEELLVAGRARDRVRRVRAADVLLTRLNVRDALAAATATALGALAAGAMLVGVVLVAVPAVRDGRLGGTMLAALALLTLAAAEAVAPLLAAAQRLDACASSAERLEEAVDRADPTPEPSRPRPLPAGGPLTVESARVRYAPAGGPWVLDGLSLTLREGEAVAVLGPSGAGKTTLADLLVRFRDPDAGRVALGGTDLRDLRSSDVRDVVRLAGQEARLFATTIAENVRIGRPGATDDELRAALAEAGLATWLGVLPDGLRTPLGEDGLRVSGGERQRIALARALLSRARFLVLDEPTAHVDEAAAAGILRDLSRLARTGRGVLVITHARDGLDGFDRVLELRDGRTRPARAMIGA